MVTKQEISIVNMAKFIADNCKTLQKKLELAGEEDLLILMDDLETHAEKVKEKIFTRYKQE